uniref:Uncharacterized protein n=1 Tax=viral metagenome TaxID=1070528 RepID=A0A6C0KH95_9ZZZZ
MNETIGKPIKIILKTNIPNNHIIEFSKDNLYKPLVKDSTGLSQYPFFTKAYKYDYSIIKSLTYNGAVKFFFNQKTFDEKIIAGYGRRSTDKDIEIHNITVMLSVLFRFNKSKMNVSFNMLNNKSEENDNKSTEIPTFTMDNAMKTLNGIFQSNANNVNTGDDVYITVNNEIYKPEKIIYINDAFNHPHYQKLLKGYIEFNKWLNSTDEREFIQIMYQYTFKQIEDKNQDYNDIIRQIQILEKALLENVGSRTDQELKDKQLRDKLEPLEKQQIILQKFIDIRKRSEYTQFYNLITEYKMDNNTELKVHIKKMLEGKENTLFKFLDNIINNKTSFKTYVVIGEKDKIETIYVLIDFIKGDNESKKTDNANINCSNQSEHLGKLLEDIMKGIKTSEKNNKNANTKILKNKEYIFSMKDNRQIKVNYRDEFFIDNYHINTPILKNIEINKDEMIDDINVRLLNKLLANNEELVKEYKFNNLDKVKSYISDILNEIKSSNKDIYDMFINCLNGKYEEAYKLYEIIKPNLGTFDSNGKKIDVPVDMYFGYMPYKGDVSILFDLIVKIIKQHHTIEEAKTQKTFFLNDIKKLNKTGGKRRSHKRRYNRRNTKKNV